MKGNLAEISYYKMANKDINNRMFWIKIIKGNRGAGFSSSSDNKESASNAGDLGSVPWWGRSPGEGNGYPLQYSCLGNPKDRGAWQTTVHEVAKSRTRLSDSPTHTGPWRPPSSLQIPSWAEREVGTPTASGSWSPGVGLADCVSLHSFDHPSSPSLITSFTPYVLCERSKFFSLNISTFSSVKWDTEPLQSDAEDRLVNRHSATRDTITPTGLKEMMPSVCVKSWGLQGLPWWSSP